MARPKKSNAETKKVIKNAETKKSNTENIYSTLRKDSNGVEELVIDWDKLRDHIKSAM